MKRVLVVGGSDEYVGAPYLAAIAALRSGAESVIVMAPEKVAWAINTFSPDVMTRKLKGMYLKRAHEREIQKYVKSADILLLGNGAGTQRETQSLMRALLRSPKLKVVDADALKAIRGTQLTNAILTPNEGEWIHLEKNSDIKKLLRHNIIIKKGTRTEILARNKHYRQRRTNPGLAKAGMGDILAGMCAGFLAKGYPLWDASHKAIDTGNVIASILTKKKKGYYFLASDLAAELKNASKN